MIDINSQLFTFQVGDFIFSFSNSEDNESKACSNFKQKIRQGKRKKKTTRVQRGLIKER